MKPVAFMRLKRVKLDAEVLEKYVPADLAIQQKLDGFKVFASKQHGKTHVYTRRGVEVTDSVPGISARVDKLLPNKTAVLGELVYEIDGKQSLQAAQSVIMAKPQKAIKRDGELGGKLVYYVYDILERKGKRVTGEPFRQRDKWVRELIPTKGYIQTLTNYTWAQRAKAFKDALAAGGEGVVIKPLDSKYKHRPFGESEPMGEQMKMKKGKKANFDDVILESYEKGKARFIFYAHQLKKGKLFEVGKLSGLPRELEKKVAKSIDAGKKVVAEVSFQERMKSGKLRHMGWSRLRPDKPQKSVTMNPGKSMSREENPRRSKVKDALSIEAVRYGNFDDFSKRYWLDCARGIYWYATNDENFKITEREIGVSKAKRFQVACNPEFALTGAANENKKYAAELNVNALESSDFEIVRGANGAKIRIVSNLDKVEVTRVLDRERALRSWKYQQSLLPSSKEQLKSFYKGALVSEKKRQEKEAMLAARTERREERQRRKKEKARGNPGMMGEFEYLPQYGGPVTVETQYADYLFAGTDEDYDLYKAGIIRIGVMDRHFSEGLPVNAADRFYAYNYKTESEAMAPSLSDALDGAMKGLRNPRKKNPAGTVPGVREVPGHINNPKY